jgi:hypothetical protein
MSKNIHSGLAWLRVSALMLMIIDHAVAYLPICNDLSYDIRTTVTRLAAPLYASLFVYFHQHKSFHTKIVGFDILLLLTTVFTLDLTHSIPKLSILSSFFISHHIIKKTNSYSKSTQSIIFFICSVFAAITTHSLCLDYNPMWIVMIHWIINSGNMKSTLLRSMILPIFPLITATYFGGLFQNFLSVLTILATPPAIWMFLIAKSKLNLKISPPIWIQNNALSIYLGHIFIFRWLGHYIRS